MKTLNDALLVWEKSKTNEEMEAAYRGLLKAVSKVWGLGVTQPEEVIGDDLPLRIRVTIRNRPYVIGTLARYYWQSQLRIQLAEHKTNLQEINGNVWSRSISILMVAARVNGSRA